MLKKWKLRNIGWKTVLARYLNGTEIYIWPDKWLHNSDRGLKHQRIIDYIPFWLNLFNKMKKWFLSKMTEIPLISPLKENVLYYVCANDNYFKTVRFFNLLVCHIIKNSERQKYYIYKGWGRRIWLFLKSNNLKLLYNKSTLFN